MSHRAFRTVDLTEGPFCPDILSLILPQLGSEDLKHCRLVCKAWAPESTQILFSTFVCHGQAADVQAWMDAVYLPLLIYLVGKVYGEGEEWTNRLLDPRSRPTVYNNSSAEVRICRDIEYHSIAIGVVHKSASLGRCAVSGRAVSRSPSVVNNPTNPITSRASQSPDFPATACSALKRPPSVVDNPTNSITSRASQSPDSPATACSALKRPLSVVDNLTTFTTLLAGIVPTVFLPSI
ncbi:hypothetical protein BJX99DRAFT_100992 [Aspergillus californicus]